MKKSLPGLEGGAEPRIELGEVRSGGFEVQLELQGRNQRLADVEEAAIVLLLAREACGIRRGVTPARAGDAFCQPSIDGVLDDKDDEILRRAVERLLDEHVETLADTGARLLAAEIGGFHQPVILRVLQQALVNFHLQGEHAFLIGKLRDRYGAAAGSTSSIVTFGTQIDMPADTATGVPARSG